MAGQRKQRNAQKTTLNNRMRNCTPGDEEEDDGSLPNESNTCYANARARPERC